MSLQQRLKSWPRLYWAFRRMRMTIGSLLPPKQLPGVPGRIHANDVMIPKRVAGHAPGYVASGEQIASLIGRHLPDSVRQRGGTGLDLGCGHGRVLRHLVPAFPSIRWTAVDIDRNALRFCRGEFGVETVVSSRRLAEVTLPSAPFDIVWMGSLVTHLDRAAEQQLWELLRRVLRPDALLVLSTLGRAGIAMLDEFVPNGGTHAEAVDADLIAFGRAYVPYPHYRRAAYGLALHSAGYLDAVIRREVSASARRVAYGPAAWLGVQDLHVFELDATSG